MTHSCGFYRIYLSSLNLKVCGALVRKGLQIIAKNIYFSITSVFFFVSRSDLISKNLELYYFVNFWPHDIASILLFL